VVDQCDTVTSRETAEAGLATAPGPAQTPRRPTWERALPWSIALIFAALYATISVARYERLATWSFDLGIFEQAIRHYAHLQAPIVDIEGAGVNFLGDHWSPAIAVFAPLYRLFPHPVTLLVGQAMVVALAVVPITRAGMRHLGTAPGTAVGLAFGMSYGVQSAIDFDFHEVCLAAPLLAFALEAFLRRRWTMVAACAAPLVLVKEDLGLTVAALGVVLVLVGARRWGITLAAFGIASFAITVELLMPLFQAPGGSFRISQFSAASGTNGSLLHRLYTLPLDVVTSPPRVATVLLLLVVTALLCLRSPITILVLPTLAWRLLSINPNHWGQAYHYDLVLMPIVFAALVDGVVRVRRSRWRPLAAYGRAAPALALSVGLVFSTITQFRSLVDPATYRPTIRAQVGGRMASEIPDGATVETDFGVVALLTRRTRVFLMGHAAPVVPDFIMFDAGARLDPLPPHPVRDAETMHPGATYDVVRGGKGFTLMRRVPSAG
jgi:uncharacterized membrane protein